MTTRAPKKVVEKVVALLPTRHLSVRAIGGRLTKENLHDDMFGLGATMTVSPPVTAEDTWRVEKLDIDALERKDPHELMQLLCDLSPDISRAQWDFLRMCNPGWACKVYRLKSKTIDAVGQEVANGFLQTLTDNHGDFNLVANRLFSMAFLRGAFLTELVLDGQGRVALDLATPDPLPIRFEKVWTPERGTQYRMYEWVSTPRGREKVYLDIPTIKYIPVDPFPGVPYGRPLISPALFSTLFLLVLLHDIRRVVQQQGYPRIDITIDFQKLQDSMPDDIDDDPAKIQAWSDGVIDQVVEMYSNLKPEQAYIHSDAITVNRPVGTIDTSSLGALPGIINILERMSVRALKTVPIVLGHADSVSEANANRQWEIYAAGIKALQHFAEVMLQHNIQLVLQAQGIQARVEFRFSELRAAELLRDTQVELLRAKVAQACYAAGWWSQDEAALYATGKEKADQKEPRATDEIEDTGAGAVASAQPDPGSTRATPEQIRELIERISREILMGDAGPVGSSNGHH